jgi:aspartyl-tRNA(Asn)/glutamyl-tRNA(Gln) amidotransferase subunit A
MSRDVEGSALLLDVIGGFDPRDPHALPSAPFFMPPEDGLKGKRVAFRPALGFAAVDPAVASLVAAAAADFAALGAVVEQVDPPGGDTRELFRTLWWAGAHYLLERLAPEKKALLDPGLARMVAEGAGITASEYIGAAAARAAYASAMRVFFQAYDLLLTPAVAVPAFAAGALSPWPDDGFGWLSWSPFSLPFNLTGQPAASVPCGFTPDGLPVGLQIVGRLYDDVAVLAAARAYEAVHPWHQTVPQGFS